MLALILRSLRDRKYSLIVYTVAAVAFLEMYIALFPALQKQAQQMSKLLETYPESMWKAFNIDKASLTFDKVGPYLAMEQFNFIWPILVVVLGIGLAGYGLANEIEKGTIEQLLAQPISRTKLFLGRYSSGLISILVFSVVSIGAIIPLTAIQGVDVSAKGVMVLTLVSFLFGWAIYSLAYLASAFFSEKSKVAFIGGGVLILMYVINILASLKDNLSFLKYFSFFYYYNPTDAIDKARFVHYSPFVFLGVIIVATLLALFWYRERDIAV
jgi:ABC-2 type transport system permease protein